MPTDKEEKFDEMLGKALRLSSEPVPANFTDRMLKQIREVEEQKILARTIMQERLALAGCIVLGVIVIVLAAVFPSIAGSLTVQAEAFADKISQTIEAVSYEWQFYIVFAGVFGFAVYSLVDLLIGDS